MQDSSAGTASETGAFEVARTLREVGVDRVFGVCGDHINALYHALATVGIDIIGLRTEAAAVQMADGYARASGQPAVVTVTGGPGHTNAVTGLAVAQSAQSPVLLISGLTPVTQRERVGQQVMYQADIVRSLTKWAIEVDDAHHLAQYVARAWTVMTQGTPGPVSLSIPVNVLSQAVPKDGQRYRVAARGVQRHPSLQSLGAPNGPDLLTRIKTARRPVMILGSGLRVQGGADQFARAMKRLALPVFTIDQARGIIPDDGRQAFGYADPLFNPVFRDIRESDLIVLVGARMDFHLCFGATHLIPPDAEFIQVTSDPSHLDVGRQADLAILGSEEAVLLELSERITPPEDRAAHRAWLGKFQERFDQWRKSWSERRLQLHGSKQFPGVHPLDLCISLSRHFTEDTAVMIDAGDFVHWARSFFPAMKPGHWMDAVLTGNLGGSLPLGMGTQMAFPDDPVWIFIGDGGFGYSAWDLSVAVERHLPIKVIVGNDACWGIEKRLQLDEYGAHYGCELPRIRYDQFAQLLGAQGVFVDKPEDLDAAVDAMCRTAGPCVLNVELTPMAGRPINDFSRMPPIGPS